jgi:pyruvate formate lyase activating enzyme
MRCAYCYNPHIVFGTGTISTSQAVEFLKKRQGLLDGVVLSGGEPTLFAGLADFCKTIKELGFATKLDTNGSNHIVLSKLVESGLVDFVSLDFKSTQEKWANIANGGSFGSFVKSLIFLVNSKINFEVRTTIHPALLDSADAAQMSSFLLANGYNREHFVQEYRHGKTIGNLPEPACGWKEKYNNNSLVWR